MHQPETTVTKSAPEEHKEERLSVHPHAGSQVAHSWEMLLMVALQLKLPDIPIPPAGCLSQQ